MGLDGGLDALTFDYNEIRPQAASYSFLPGVMEKLEATTSEIEIVLNGQARRAPAACSLRGLLLWLEVDPARVAVELNRSIVPRQEWDRIIVEAGATLEVVQFVGGG